MDELTNKVEQWAMARDLHTANPDKQMLKLGEEFGELCEAMAKDKPLDKVDAIGDMFVVLTILSMQLGTSIDNCIKHAYEQIEFRKGKTVNGVYIKESDLT